MEIIKDIERVASNGGTLDQEQANQALRLLFSQQGQIQELSKQLQTSLARAKTGLCAPSFFMGTFSTLALVAALTLFS